MGTGDLLNNINILKSALKSIKYEGIEPDWEIIKEKGEAHPLIFLPIINYILLQYSKPVAAWIIDNGLHMIGTNDTKFMKLAFKLARDHFGFNPTITLHQFFSTGFAERKIMYTSELIKHVREKHKELEKVEQAKKKTFVGPENRLYPKPKLAKGEEDKENIPIKSKLTKLKSAMKASKEAKNAPEPLSEKIDKNFSHPSSTYTVVEEIPEITIPGVKAITEEFKSTKWNPISTIAPEDDLNEEDIDENDEVQIEEVQAQDVDNLFPQDEQELISYSLWENEQREHLEEAEEVLQIPQKSKASSQETTKDLQDVKQMLEVLNLKLSDFQSKIDQNLTSMQTRFSLVEGKMKGMEDKTTQIRTPQKQIVNNNLVNPSTPIQKKHSPVPYEVRLDVMPSPTFITDVPESMMQLPSRKASSTFQNAQQYIISIAQRFKETQELINSRKPSFFKSALHL